MSDLAAVVRFVHLTAAILLAGSFSFIVLIALPAFLTGKDSAETDYQILSATAHDRSLLLAGDFSIGLTWPLDSDRQRERGLDWNSFQLRCDFLAHHGDQYGRVWLARMVIALLLGLLLIAQSRQQDAPVSLAALFGGAFSASVC